MLVWMRGMVRAYLPLLVVGHTGVATVEISVELPQELEIDGLHDAGRALLGSISY